jgi:cytochrome d ubiquinol oxidase subunit II
LLGASWLVSKSEGILRDRAYALLPALTLSVLGLLGVAFVFALSSELRIMHRWLDRPYLLIFPVIGALAAAMLVRGIAKQNDSLPFRMTVIIFVSAFATMAISFWPYMIPFAVTIEQGAGPPESLHFMFWGAGLCVLPLTLGYTAVVYRIFRGKIVDAEYH